MKILQKVGTIFEKIDQNVQFFELRTIEKDTHCMLILVSALYNILYPTLTKKSMCGAFANIRIKPNKTQCVYALEYAVGRC